MEDRKRCGGPLHKGALLPLSEFKEGQKTCLHCLDRNKKWRNANAEKLKRNYSWDKPEVRLRKNLHLLGLSASIKKEAFEPLLMVGMGWSNFYVKGKRSWKLKLVDGKPIPYWMAFRARKDKGKDSDQAQANLKNVNQLNSGSLGEAESPKLDHKYPFC